MRLRRPDKRAGNLDMKARYSIERNLSEIHAHDQSRTLARGGWWNLAIADGPPAPVRTLGADEIAALGIAVHEPRPDKATLWGDWLASVTDPHYADKRNGLNTLAAV